MKFRDFLRESVALYFGSCGYLVTRLLPLLLIAEILRYPEYENTLIALTAGLGAVIATTFGAYLLLRHYLPESPIASRALPSILLWLLLGQLYVNAVVTLVATLFSLASSFAGAVAPVFWVLLIVAAVLLYAITMFHPVYIVLRGQTTFGAIASSVELSRGNVGRLTVLVGVLAAFIIIIGYGISWLWDSMVSGPNWLSPVRMALLDLLKFIAIAVAVAGYRLLEGDGFVSPRDYPEAALPR